MDLINVECGGLRNGHKFKGVIPGGSSVPILRPEECDVRMDFDSLAAKGTLLGSCGVMVIDETACMVRLALRTARFYAEESCGQCTQCREGTWWLYQILTRIQHGRGRAGELEILLDLCTQMKGRTICPLSDAAPMPVESYIKTFSDELAAHHTEQR